MVSPTRRPASALAAFAAFGLASAWAGTASAQFIFDPYQPLNADYYNFTSAAQPVNFALPGAAREAAALYSTPAGGGLSRYNTFDRWLQDYESDSVRGRRSGAGGSSDRDRNDPNRYIPNREADRGFYEREERRDGQLLDAETTRARIARERDRYYAAAGREKDPARRAAYLKVVKALSDPKSAPNMLRDIDEAEAERRRPAEARRPAGSDPGPIGRSVLSNPAMGPARATPSNPGPGPIGPSASPAAPASGRIAGPATASPSGTSPAPRPAASTPNRGTTVKLPDTAPPMPVDPPKPGAAPVGPAPRPPAGTSGLAEPDPIPDSAPPPPR